jgi:hypothetical protein
VYRLIPRGVVPAGLGQRVRSAVPVLLLNGEVDNLKRPQSLHIGASRA